MNVDQKLIERLRETDPGLEPVPEETYRDLTADEMHRAEIACISYVRDEETCERLQDAKESGTNSLGTAWSDVTDEERKRYTKRAIEYPPEVSSAEQASPAADRLARNLVQDPVLSAAATEFRKHADWHTAADPGPVHMVDQGELVKILEQLRDDE